MHNSITLPNIRKELVPKPLTLSGALNITNEPIMGLGINQIEPLRGLQCRQIPQQLEQVLLPLILQLGPLIVHPER